MKNRNDNLDIEILEACNGVNTVESTITGIRDDDVDYIVAEVYCDDEMLECELLDTGTITDMIIATTDVD